VSGRPSGTLLGIGGLLLAICCVAAPLLLGIAIGAALGGLLDFAAAVLIAAGVAMVIRRRRTTSGGRC
jgi:hypothetical protein